jgi:hypothetical protein
MNTGKKPVEFLYSFLEVKDSNGQSLNAIAEDLPDTLPADGKPYAGTIQIPASVITDSDFISLKLSDYPQQKVTLGFDKIPIGQ